MPVQQYDIVLNYDTSKATASLGAFRAEALRQFGEIASKTAKIELFKDLQSDSTNANNALASVKDRAEVLRGVLARLNKDDVGFKQLTAEVKAVEKELRAAEKSAGVTADRVKTLSGELKAAGINTANLAAEQLALAKALDAAQKAAATQTARGVLGVVNYDEARGQIAKYTEAYNVLRADGSATLNELAQAKSRLVAKTIEVNAQTSIWTGSMQQLQFAFISVIGSVGAYALAISAVTASASRYEQGLASIASITTLNKVQLDALGQSVLRLAGQIGLDGVEAFRALYSIIGSGIPPENALKVLESSSRAAIAGLTGVENAAKIGVQVLNAYQLQVGQLDRVYDILFQTVRDGVISFEELAEKFGLVLPAARTAGVSLEELSAATVVLTRNGLTAPRAMVALEGAIKQLAAPSTEAAGAMAELGIEYNGFAGTIEQFARKNIGPELLRRLIPDVEGQRAVALLTSNYRLLASSLDEATNASGATRDAFDKLKDTPEQSLKKFNAELDRARVAAGKALLEGLLPLLNGMTDLIKAFNELPAGVRTSVTTLVAVGGALAVATIAAKAITPVIAPLVSGLAVMGGAGAAAAAGINATQFALTKLGPAALTAGVGGYEIGKWLRESSVYARQLGDALGGNLAAAVIDVTERIRLMKAILTLDIDEHKRASAAIEQNKVQWVELQRTMGEAGNAIRDLEIKQAALRKGLEQSQAAIGATGAKFTEAFSSVVEAVDKPLTELGNRINRTTASIEAANARIGASAAAAKDQYTAQVGQIDQLLAQQTASIALQVASREITEIAAINKVTKATTEANAARLKALNDSAKTAIAAFDSDAAARIAIARKTGSDIEKIEIELRSSRITLLNELSAKYNEYITGAKKGEEDLRDKVKSVDEQIRSIRSAQADFNNRLNAKTSGDVLAYYDRSNQAEIALAAAARATGAEREKYLERAKTLAASLGDAVSDAAGREVSADRARATAQSVYARAVELEVQQLNEKKAALQANQEAYRATGEAAVAQGVDIRAQLDKLFPEQGEKITLRLEKDDAQIKSKIDELNAAVLAQAPLSYVKLQIDDAKAAYDVFKLAVEKNKPQVEIEGKFDTFKDKAAEVFASLPQVPVKVDDAPAKAAIDALKTSVTAFFATKHALQSNIDEITAKVKALGDLDTSSTHTVFVKYVDAGGKAVTPPAGASGAAGFNSGGHVTAATARARGGAIQAFASGGFVGKVPGVGNKDTVRARLRAGGFILRKTPSEILAALSGGGSSADGVFNRLRNGSSTRAIPSNSRLARGVDVGERADGSVEGIIARIGATDSFKRRELFKSMFDEAFRLQELSIRELRAKFPAGYIEGNAEAYSRHASSFAINRAMAQYDGARGSGNRRLADTATTTAEELARGIATPARGLSLTELGELFSNRKAIEAYQKELEREAKEKSDAEKAAKDAGKPPPEKKAAGGTLAGAGVIDALLTPGEISFSPEDVKRIGLGRLHSLNAANTREQVMANMLAFNAGGQVPSRDQIMSNMLALNAGGQVPTMAESFAENVLPILRRFNEGGSVNNVSNANSSSNTFSQTITINAGSNVNERAIARIVFDELKNIERRRK